MVMKKEETPVVANDIKPGREEIYRLKEMLEKDGVPFDWKESARVSHLSYPTMGKKRVCSVIQGTGTYGGDVGRLEIMGLLTEKEMALDRVCGWLTAEDVHGRIMAHFKSAEEKK